MSNSETSPMLKHMNSTSSIYEDQDDEDNDLRVLIGSNYASDEKSALINEDFPNVEPAEFEIINLKGDLDERGGKISNVQAYLGMVRASIGPGCLALPYAFSKSGIPIGMGMLLIICMFIYYNVVTLVQMKRSAHKAGSYGDVGFAAAGRIGRFVVEFALVSMEFGICTVYFGYCSTNLGSAFNMSDLASRRILMLLLFPVLGGLAMIRQMRTLAMLSGVANVFMLIGMSIIIFYLIDKVSTDGPLSTADDPVPFHSDTKLMYTIATIIYSFEGVGCMLPIENSMAKPHEFYKVLTIAFATYLAMYMLIGGLGATTFNMTAVEPPDDRGSVSTVISFYYNDGADKQVVRVLNVLLSIAVAMTYPVQFFAAIEVLEHHFHLDSHSTRVAQVVKHKKTKRFALRTVAVLLTMSIAIAIPNLGIVIAFFGSLFGGMIAMVLPPALYILNGRPSSTGRSVFNFISLIVGLAVCIGGTIQSAINIADSPFGGSNVNTTGV
eukprot:m.123457 g.123457  ORF g.123457 m.123457 type:complete len:495 (+) comp28990_c0_seq1:349-1833(+)